MPTSMHSWTTTSPASAKPADFYDNSHLNDIGAIKFTKILDNDIKSLKQ